MNFSIGDKVFYKKGGPAMTVDYVVGLYLPEHCGVYYAGGLKKGMVICSWPSGYGYYKGKIFNPEDLQIVMTAAQQN